MRWIPTFALAVVTSFLLPTDVAWSQMVRVYRDGGVSVRAPFVRVQVGPNGQRSVRAPFVAIDTAGRRRGAPHAMPGPEVSGGPSTGMPSQPTPADSASLDWQALRRMLHSGVTRLQDQLNGIATGEGWREYLRTTQLVELAADDANWPPGPEAVEAFRETFDIYEAAWATGESRAITSLAGFGTVHAALKELAISPLDRQRKQLAHSARDLERELMGLDTGSEWLRHLRLPDEIVIGQSSADRGAPLPPTTDGASEENLDQLIDVLARFDAVGRNPEYREVRELPAFKTTHDRLATYVGLVGATLSGDPSGNQRMEIVPTPQPELF